MLHICFETKKTYQKFLVIFLAKQSTRDSPSKSLDHITLVDLYYSTKMPPIKMIASTDSTFLSKLSLDN